jgi:hypothetical protein
MPVTIICERCQRTFRRPPSARARFCSLACANEAQRTDLSDRFWAKVQKTDTCWLWTGTLRPHGYGEMSIGRRGFVRAHRLSWVLHHGPIPDEAWVLHRCDNTRCVNPDHLFLGTPKDNTQDMLHKGRHRPSFVRGEQNGRARLRRTQVQTIRTRYAAGALVATLAREYDVSEGAIQAIIQGRTWKRPY